MIRTQSALIQRLNARIEQLETRIADLESRVPADAADETSGSQEATEGLSASSEPASPASPPGGSGSNDAGDADALPGLSEDERREQERLVRAAFQRTLIDRGGLLLPPGTMDIQPSLNYLHSSAENIVIDGFTILPVLVVGDIVSERMSRDFYQTSATVRAGLPWRSQIEVRVPYGYQQQRRFSADGEETVLSGSGLGDAELSFSKELWRSRGRWPDLLGSLRWKSTSGTSPFGIDTDTQLATGTGYDSVSLALTGVKVVDPVVYFGSVSYGYNQARTEAFGRYDPGDTVGFSLGMAVALNLNGSISFSYDQQSTRHAKIDGTTVPGSYLTTGVFTVGASFAISDSLTADLSLGVGVTADSPDIQLGASFPIRRRR